MRVNCNPIKKEIRDSVLFVFVFLPVFLEMVIKGYSFLDIMMVLIRINKFSLNCKNRDILLNGKLKSEIWYSGYENPF